MGRIASVLPKDSSGRTETSLLSPMAFYYFLLVPMSALALVNEGYFYPYHLLVRILVGLWLLGHRLIAPNFDV